ncbi:sigma-70 family RNA polymerase sigma factor [Candidatus Saccharibacteria bacterium]|nr:sigma-70 family RNA polymerase sigma factor [Candidatus Saccharibacteria bacterium]
MTAKNPHSESFPTCPPSHEGIFLGDDIFGLYRHDTKKHKRIDNDTMLSHVEDLQAGLGAQKQLDSDAELSRNERDELLCTVKKGMEARNSIVVANTGLVFKWARINKSQGVDEEDLIQEGNIALMRAAELFNPSSPTSASFSTYATRRIRADVAKAVHNYSRTIRIPRDLSITLKSLRQKEEYYFGITGKKMSTAELADAMNMSEEAVEDLRSIEIETMSLNYDYDNGVDDNPELENYIKDTVNSDFDEKIIGKIDDFNKREIVGEICDDSGLNDTEKEILWLRFAEDQPFEHIAKIHSISNHHASRIANTALKKIRENVGQSNKAVRYKQLLEDIS